MLGEKSELSTQSIAAFKVYNDLFDYEVHGSRLSLATTMKYMKGEDNLKLVPSFTIENFKMYLNRYVEICWLLHRLLPLTQPPKVPLNAKWKSEWVLLDKILKKVIEEYKLPISHAFIEFVESKFPYTEESYFFL
jgi:hypothetical protein